MSRKPGRPSRTPGGPRLFAVKVSDDWLARAQALAAKENVSVGDYVRAAVLLAEMIENDPRAVLAMLGDPNAKRTIVELVEREPKLFPERQGEA